VKASEMSIKVVNPKKVSQIRAIRDNVLVKNIERGLERTRGGIILPDDNMKDRGIKARWGQVYAVGPEQTDVKPGDFVLIEHARWTRGLPIETDSGESFYLHKVENHSILLISDEDPTNRASTFDTI
jgi:co-chaperonin GroES (HSP10)